MQFTTLPGSDLSVSRLCLGTMTFGSPVAGPDAIRLVHYAAELGVNFIDTANMYEGYNRFAGSAGGAFPGASAAQKICPARPMGPTRRRA